MNRTTLSNALTGTLTIGCPLTDPDTRTRRLNGPRLTYVDPALLENCAIIDRDDNDEIDPAKFSDRFLDQVRSATERNLTGQLLALAKRVIETGMDAPAFFITANSLDRGKIFDARDLAALYRESIYLYAQAYVQNG